MCLSGKESNNNVLGHNKHKRANFAWSDGSNGNLHFSTLQTPPDHVCNVFFKGDSASMTQATDSALTLVMAFVIG